MTRDPAGFWGGSNLLGYTARPATARDRGGLSTFFPGGPGAQSCPTKPPGACFWCNWWACIGTRSGVGCCVWAKAQCGSTIDCGSSQFPPPVLRPRPPAPPSPQPPGGGGGDKEPDSCKDLCGVSLCEQCLEDLYLDCEKKKPTLICYAYLRACQAICHEGPGNGGDVVRCWHAAERAHEKFGDGGEK